MRRLAGRAFVFAVGTAACGPGADTEPEAGPCGSRPASGGETLKVMTVNLRHDSDDWEARFPLIADEIVRLDPDLVGLQEVEIGIGQGQALLDLVRERGGPEYHYDQEYKTGFAAAGGEGIGVLSRFPIASREAIDLENGRPLLLARIEREPGVTIDFYNTHLHHVGDDDDVRLAQATRITTFMETESACDPVLLTGDMNDTDDSAAIGRFVEAGLVDTYRDVHGEATAETGNTSSIKLAEGAFEQNPTRRIDYVFARSSPHVTVTPEDSLVCFKNHDERGLYPSDHLGVMTTVTLAW